MPPEKVLFLLKIDYSNQMTCSIVAKRCSMIRMRASNFTAASFLRRLGFIVKNNNNNTPPPACSPRVCRGSLQVLNFYFHFSKNGMPGLWTVSDKLPLGVDECVNA